MCSQLKLVLRESVGVGRMKDEWQVQVISSIKVAAWFLTLPTALLTLCH